jgi:hypothetical protein
LGSLPVVHVELPTFGIRAGPREEIYFDPSNVTAAIVVVGEQPVLLLKSITGICLTFWE